MHFLTILQLINCYFIITINCCNSFNNTTALVRTKDGLLDMEFVLNGCLNEKSFENKVRQIIIYSQPIDVIENGTFKNLKYLKRLSIIRSGVKKIESGAFKNLIRIKEILITFGSLKRIPNGLFNGTNTKTIFINNNGLEIIEKYAFSNMKNLKKLFASRNKMSYFDNEWFVNSRNLKTIDFQNNLLRTIPPKAFVYVRNIKKIFFDFNEIVTIQPKAFKKVKKLKYLGLRYNKLIYIDQKAFPKNIKINSMRIDANRLNYLPQLMMIRIIINDIYVNGNPWKCECFQKIIEWIARVNGTLRNDVCKHNQIPLCVMSTYFDSCLETYEEELFAKFLKNVKMIDNVNKYCVRFN